IRVTNLPGADLNAAGSGFAEASPMDGPSNEGNQRTCSLKYDGYNTDKEKPVEAAATTGFLLLVYRFLIYGFLGRHSLLLNISSI
ncbi:hypothetical protein, partial [Yersinia enterocolitica]|uniref:hypothetical protein n=1 Tax=Yersinia enterocolitica TaxID=630 RepID=UPI0039F25C03